MTLRNEAGQVLNKTEFTALTEEVPQPAPDRRLTATIFETYSLSGEGDRFESGKRRKFKAGTVLTQAQIDALFAPAATAASIAPATGPAAGGTPFTITGTDLSGTEGVTFDGVAATDVVVVNNTTVTGVSPAGAAGPADVVVQDDSGNVTKVGFFTYT